MMKYRLSAHIAIAATLLLSSGWAEETSTHEPDSLIKHSSHGPLELTISATPAKVHYDKDIVLSIAITCPSEVDLILPTIRDRIQGFTFNGEYTMEPSTVSGKTIHQKQAMLTPMIDNEYRLARIPIIYIDRSRHPAVTNWFATEPIVFEVTPPLGAEAPGSVRSTLKPIWIYPPFRTVAGWIGILLGVILLIVVLWKLLRRIKRQIQLARMSPRERALFELDELLQQQLPQKNMIKEFYLELTMIVRRYVERRHAIRAPEQTTEEFLTAVSSDARFTTEVLQTLKTFLEAADLVKFAAYTPDGSAIGKATDTAKQYIETDDTSHNGATDPQVDNP